MKSVLVRWLTALLGLAMFSRLALAQVPQFVSYQGRVAVNGVPFEGAGQFKFALVDGTGTTTYWSNDGTSTAGSPPTASVTLALTRGLYSVLLGDTTLTGMTVPLGPSVFANADLRLRVWFDDGARGSQLLTPDQRLAAVGYVMLAASVPDAAITSAKLAAGAVGAGQIAPGVLAAPLGAPAGTQAAAANVSYTATGIATTTFLLPATANVGDLVQVTGAGSGGWIIARNVGTARENARQWTAIASASDGSRLVASADSGQLYTSTDSGAIWTPRDSTRRWKSVASSSDGTKLVAADSGNSADGLLYTSIDSGASWTPRASPLNWLAVASSADGTKLVAAADQIYTSADSGLTWIPQDSPRNWRAVASSADGTRLVAAVAGGQLYTSTDSGGTWTPRDSARNWVAVASSTDGTTLLAAESGGRLYTSVDLGLNWAPRDGARPWSSVTSAADGTRMVAGVFGGPIYTSTDSGLTWAPRDSARNWAAVASSADGSQFVAVENAGQIYTWGSEIAGGQGSAARVQYLGGGQWGPVGVTRVSPGIIGTAQLADGAVTQPKLAPGAVGSAQLAGAAVGTAQLAAGGVTQGKLASGAVGESQLADSAVTQAKLAVSAVGATQLADGSVTQAKLTLGAVGAAQLASPAVGIAQLADGAVIPSKLAPGAVGTFQLADGGVTQAKLAAAAVGNAQLASDSGSLNKVSGGVIISSAGNLGVGAPVPIEKVEVVGTVKATAFKGDGSQLTGIPMLPATPPAGMVLIPSGPFVMGDLMHDLDVTGANPVGATVSGFYMDVNEVSLSLWNSVSAYAVTHGYSYNPGTGKAANHPVQNVNWYDAVKWCNARSEQAGKPPVYFTDAGLTVVYRTGEVPVFPRWTAAGYRLPTEAEWEKAGRGGLAGQRFPWGNVINENLANYTGNTADAYDIGPDGYNPTWAVGGLPYTSPGGSFLANGFGLNDMAGNVWEWCWDWYASPYAGGVDPHGASSGLLRVLRGGSWFYFGQLCRVADGSGKFPTDHFDDVGFRSVLIQ